MHTHAHTHVYKQNISYIYIYICHSALSEIHVIILFSSFLSFQFLMCSPCHASVKAFQSHFLFSLSVLLLAALSRSNYFPASQILIIFPPLSFPLQFFFLIPNVSIRAPKLPLCTHNTPSSLPPSPSPAHHPL